MDWGLLYAVDRVPLQGDYHLFSELHADALISLLRSGIRLSVASMQGTRHLAMSSTMAHGDGVRCD